jgi:hypothetical protein
MITDITHAAVGDLARVTFTRENGTGDPMVDGEVTEIDEDPPGREALVMQIDEAGRGNAIIIVREGTWEGETYSEVFRNNPFGDETKIGTEGHVEFL